MADFTRITPRLWVGSHPTRADAQAIARAGATYAVDVRGEPSANGPPEVPEPQLWEGTGVRYASVPMRDNGTPIPAAKYAEAVALIESAIRSGGTVILYCAAGENRSPSVAYAYLRKTGLSPEAAWAAVAQRRIARRQYVPCADRYLAGIGIGTYTGGCGSSTPVTTTTTTTKPAVSTPDSGSSLLSWLAIAAIATGVYYFFKHAGPRANPWGEVSTFSVPVTAGSHRYVARDRRVFGDGGVLLSEVFRVTRDDGAEWRWDLKRGQRLGVVDTFGRQLDLPDYIMAQELLEKARRAS
jgi:protein tyrosine phosphatase (PTP) superfamily phosphohydrolase (DUF442 family)